MTSTKRVQRLAVAAAVLSAGAFVAGPAASTASPAPTAAPAERVASMKVSTNGDDGARSADGARAAFNCELALKFRPRVGKGHKRIISTARVTCGTAKNPGPKMPHIWTSVQLKQTKAKDKYKKTDKANTRHNKSQIRTFCPRESRKYTVIGRATVKLPKSAAKKQLTLHKSGEQTGPCRVG